MIFDTKNQIQGDRFMARIKLNVTATIEETLIQIEDANYNVAQGYKAFK